MFTKDFCGTVIHINTRGINIIEQTKDFATIEVKAGENWDDFIDFCTKNQFFGVENLSGIPGKVGSCPVQNIGAYGVEVKDMIKEVHTREIATGKGRVFSNAACKFGYRDSVFKNKLKHKVLITSVVFQLSKHKVFNLNYKALRDELQIYPDISLSLVQEKVKEIRNRKLPDVAQIGSAGSFFKNPVITKENFEKLQKEYPQLTCFEIDETSVKLAAAQLIEISGWKGFREGDAGVYPHQPLVLVNYGSATGEEIMNLATKIKQSVLENFGVKLECEVQMMRGLEDEMMRGLDDEVIRGSEEMRR